MENVISNTYTTFFHNYGGFNRWLGIMGRILERMEKKMRFLCIDPGLSGTGIAVFNERKLVAWRNIYPKGETFQEKAVDVCREIPLGFHTAFCEWPTGNFGGAKALAARNSDAILKLCFLIGKLSTQFNEFNLVPVIKWKGQLKKEITQKRAEEFFHQKGFTSHCSDAVGIGKYVLQNNLI